MIPIPSWPAEAVLWLQRQLTSALHCLHKASCATSLCVLIHNMELDVNLRTLSGNTFFTLKLRLQLLFSKQFGI